MNLNFLQGFKKNSTFAKSFYILKNKKNMKFKAEIDVMPLKALLDPQGKAVTASMHNIGYSTVQNVRIGKHITLEIDADEQSEAEKKIEEACKNILSNPVMESYEFELIKI